MTGLGWWGRWSTIEERSLHSVTRHAKLRRARKNRVTPVGMTSNGLSVACTQRISARRGAVLAYINSLLLRTLPVVDYDRNNIKDPSKPRPNQKSAPTAAPHDALIDEIDPTKKPS